MMGLVHNEVNNTLLFYALQLGIFLIGYLIGNFSPAYLAGRWFGKLDIRDYGSGNAGTTNVMRVLGWKYGVAVYILDVVKGFTAAAVGSALGGAWGAAIAGIGVVIGHDLPLLLNLRGGKGIASTTGIFLFLFPVPAMISLAFYLLLILATRMVSAGSLAFVISFLLYCILSGQAPVWVVLSAFLALFAFIRHSDNIERILQGRENKISFGNN